ncbi:LNS2-domain-containing protein [Lentinus tigrinus ALCF2SS1-7]|uniref:phosphatidate phosphatase n=1 Tax=Lentinus tigrinus ALCF2SS1-6 TaxID=1328759 RepID=A0A5C2SSP8_9APHY|nr:LNS2-domain-containing protein [Lentinus tigrinus ALCF2SS1-6]RPD80868.1 LNS2-domain-containing protein [Lentinus tigrinus ALCF2SS1-7]
MNYLRGAVSAISAPYQYYKDLNPSTLTGAIDVIVVRRPKNLPDHPTQEPAAPLSEEETELVCSPFHVRFGKWQVLRPQDKKVDMFVNGQLVPFSMKIGEAGEAFFVFETEDEIPDNLVTSPILEATQPGQTNAQTAETGRFGAGPASPAVQDSAGSSQEPEFLDLDATSDTQLRENTPSAPQSSGEPSQSQDGKSHGPGIITKTAQLGKAMMGVAQEAEKAEEDKFRDKTILEGLQQAAKDNREFLKHNAIAAKRFAGVDFPTVDERGGEVFPEVTEPMHEPHVKYGNDMVFDVEGYHASQHEREASDATIRSGSTRGRRSSRSDTSSLDRTPGPSRTPSPPAQAPSLVPFPRATSEPPPDHEDGYEPSSSRHPVSAAVTRMPSSIDGRPHLPSLPTINPPDSEEYTWDWGNFPQKTPIRTTFAHVHPHGHLPGVSADLSPRKGKGRMMSAIPDAQYAPTRTAPSDRERTPEEDAAPYGYGGRLTMDKNDPTRYRVFIEGRTIEFELAIVPGSLGGGDEVEDYQCFEQGKVDFERFMNDESVVHDENLVLCWAGDKYIRRQDGSPLMEALVTWREAALRDQQSLVSSRPVSPQPLSEDESVRSDEEADDRRPKRTMTDSSVGSDVSAKDNAATRTPTSSSWARWWSRSRRAESTRPDLGHTNSDPSHIAAAKADLKPTKSASGVPLHRTSTSSSAPPVASTRRTTPATTPQPIPEASETLDKRFAKTLRLTSDQLKSLNLKPGANSVTFSLSATGVAACSARLFVWEYTDQVVVSDIDGTITKSDALGHVFTMIGRDWTHVGVAKLYTDICRNGYKILYLTSRAIGQADSTREYLKGIKQNDYQLPEGPVIMSPDRLMASLHREVIMRKPEVFKMACLRDIQKLFGGPAHNPFYAGFGNRITDALSYRSVNIPSSRIFTIDSTGEVKMELLELAGYKSSYIHMTDLVDQMFPPINRKWASEYTDFNYWKPPMQDFPLPDLSPPSPALSARSDTSNQSTFARIRNFSLVGSRQPTRSFALPPPATEAGQQQDANGNETRLRQMSSFERLSNTLATLTQSSSSTAGSPRSSSPTLHDSGESDSEYEDEGGDLEKARRRRRRRSDASMPGSLPSSQPGSDDEMVFGEDDEDDEDHGYEGENEEEVPDEAFDEALFAAGEMKNVDYI